MGQKNSLPKETVDWTTTVPPQVPLQYYQAPAPVVQAPPVPYYYPVVFPPQVYIQPYYNHVVYTR